MKNILKKYRMPVYLISVALLFVFIRVALYDGLTVTHYTLQSYTVTKNHTFAVITDLHSTYYGSNQRELAEEIEKYSPEAIFLVGDISEDKREFDGTAALLELIVDTYPCYYVTGNHERWVEYTDDIHSLFSDHGVTVLAGDSVELGDGITLHGIDDPLFFDSDEHFYQVLESFSPSPDKLDILLSHRPEYSKMYTEMGFDLTLSGHAHGGQVRIPLILNGLYAPHQGFFPEYAGGRYDIDGCTVIVSRGLMKDDIPRVFNPPELLVVTVSPLN